MKRFLKKKYILMAVLVLALSAFGLRPFLEGRAASAKTNVPVVSDNSLQTFTSEQLKKYNGTDLKSPIYLALDGYIYDISKGSEYYKTGGAYHYLAGKDSSFELHMFGGDIIKKKYPIIGRLVSN